MFFKIIIEIMGIVNKKNNFINWLRLSYLKWKHLPLDLKFTTVLD